MWKLLNWNSHYKFTWTKIHMKLTRIWRDFHVKWDSREIHVNKICLWKSYSCIVKPNIIAHTHTPFTHVCTRTLWYCSYEYIDIQLLIYLKEFCFPRQNFTYLPGLKKNLFVRLSLICTFCLHLPSEFLSFIAFFILISKCASCSSSPYMQSTSHIDLINLDPSNLSTVAVII